MAEAPLLFLPSMSMSALRVTVALSTLPLTSTVAVLLPVE